MVSYAKWDNFTDSSDDEAASAPRVVSQQTNPFPHIIIQTSKDGFPHEQDWKIVNNAVNDDAFLVMTYPDKNAEEVVSRNYPWFLKSYQGLGHGVERADLFRYLAVHQYAGYYSDTDVMPIVPVDLSLIHI